MYWILEEMTWEEAKEAIKLADYVILPTGSLEQHGLHLPLSVDNIRADNLTNEILKRANKYNLKLLKLPTLTYGCSEHHMHFPGTVTLELDTYIKVIRDIAVSMHRHGAKRFLIMNFHGGNLQSLNIAIQIIRKETGMKTYLMHWTQYARDLIEQWAKPGWGHACEHETSMIMYYKPELVRKEKIRKPKIKAATPITEFRYFDEITDTGGIGDPTIAKPEYAERIIGEVSERMLKILSETIKVE
ncbi:MAG: creatininase family protein [Candidatus Methanomethylicia archaeon]